MTGRSSFVYFGAKSLCEPARPEVRGKNDGGCWSVRSGTQAVRELESQDRDAGRDAGREGSCGVRKQHGISEDDSQSETGCEAVKVMTRDESASFVAV